MKKTTLLLIAIFSLQLAYAQQHPEVKRTWHWYFGQQVGIDFSQNSPILKNNLSNMFANAGCTTISDSLGNLLFYSDGVKVWNSQYSIMDNGAGLMGNNNSHQIIIIPKPNDTNIYYLFTTDAYENNFQNGVRYSIIDMSLNSGLGKVIEKNKLLTLQPCHEQIAAVHHNNCNDIWLITHKKDQNIFLSYLITQNGIDTVPIINNVGNAINLPYGCASLAFSPNGKYLASLNYWEWSMTGVVDSIELYDFDKSSGILRLNEILCADTMNAALIFSPDNSKLYVSGGGTTPNIKIYQFDLNATNINASKTIVYESNTLVYWYDAQFSPIDSIIYFLRTGTDTLSIIHNPNFEGINCYFEDKAFPLEGSICNHNFPNFITSYFNTDSTAYNNCNLVSTEDVIRNQVFEVYPNPFDKQTEINTNNREIIYYNLYNIKGKQQNKNNDYKLKQTDNTYLFTNKKLKGAIYILSGVFADKEQFNIKLIIN